MITKQCPGGVKMPRALGDRILLNEALDFSEIGKGIAPVWREFETV
jgi:hypothetical protein